MTSVAKDRTRLRRIFPNQNHNKHLTPGIIINYLIFFVYIFFYYVIYIYNYTWCIVFVMILIRINSIETSAACAAGVICFFIHYSLSPQKCLTWKVFEFLKDTANGLTFENL